MKQVFIFSFITIIFVATAGVVSATTTAEQSRATIIRSSDASDGHERGDRARVDTSRDTTETPNAEGNGTVLNVTYNAEDGKLEVEFENAGDDSSARITIIINGEVVTGGQNQGNANTSENGVDGVGGSDGSSSNSGGDTSGGGSVDEDDRIERPSRPARNTR